MFDNLFEALDDELMEMDRRAKSGDKLSPTDIQFGDCVAHFAKSLATYEAMRSSSTGYSNRGYSRDGGYYDPMMGRGYSYQDNSRGYSRADGMPDMDRGYSRNRR